MSSAISKVKQKLKQVKFRHLKAYLKENLKADPRNCTHNEITISPKGEVCVCGYEGSDTYGKICDVNFSQNRAINCSLFCPKRNKEQLKSEFYSFIDNSTVGELAKEFPDVTALMWVLDTLGADDTDTELKEHYEKIESLTVAKTNLITTVEDLKRMVSLQTNEINKLESEKDRLSDILSERDITLKELSEELETLSLEKSKLNERIDSINKENNELEKQIKNTFWSKFLGFFR